MLAAFPVPRLEIKEASIQLRFAVNAVEQKEVDRAGITRNEILRHSDIIANAVIEDFVGKHPRSDEIGKIIDSKGLDLRKILRDVVEGAATADAKVVDAALKGQPQALIDRISAEVVRKVLEDPDIKKELSRGTRVGALREAVRVPVDTAVSAFVGSLATALDSAGRQATRVQVAVTRSELAQVPEPLISHVSVVMQIRNYQWSEVERTDGTTVRRLNPE
ncbi:MAG: hypothetical protein ACREEP_20230 [Dongiaceae bacterium]